MIEPSCFGTKQLFPVAPSNRNRDCSIEKLNYKILPSIVDTMQPAHRPTSAFPAPAAEPVLSVPPEASILSNSTAGSPSESVTSFLEKTGFPDLALVSSRIIDHAKEIALSTAAEFNLKIRFLAFDGICSAAQGRALPGSDMDELIAVVELMGVQRQATLWDRICFRDVQRMCTAAEKAAARSFEEAFKDRLDHDLIGYDQTLKAISLCELEDLFLTYSSSDDSFPSSMWDAELLVLHQKQGVILVNDLYRLGDRWGHTDAYQHHLAPFQALESFFPPSKFKVQSRESLIAQFPDLSHDEQLLVIEIMRSDVSNARRPAVLSADNQNPYLQIAKKLEEKKLLFFFDRAEEGMTAAIDATYKRGSWLDRLALPNLQSQRYVAPWKLYHLDEMILSEYFDPTKMQALHQALEKLPSADGLPITLKAWWSNIHDSACDQKDGKIRAKLAEKARL